MEHPSQDINEVVVNELIDDWFDYAVSVDYDHVYVVLSIDEDRVGVYLHVDNVEDVWPPRHA